jgi:uncharacterized protein YbjT (DUF2867 family)
MKYRKVLLAGATGYLGRHIAAKLSDSQIPTRLIVRNTDKAKFFDPQQHEIAIAQVTQAESLNGICNGIDVVISTVGITRQKEGLTYMDVDYQANVNLLKEAQKAGVRKFIYVSVLNGRQLTNIKICEAKERFVDELKNSGIAYCIIRPNGFFSDMGDFLEMAKGGRVFLFGNGKLQLNPIHGADLAELCVSAIERKDKEIEVGGPDVLTHNLIAAMALKALNKPVKIIHLPDWIRRFSVWAARTFTSSKTYGSVEFFLTSLGLNMVAPTYGTHHLEDFFNKKSNKI